MCMYACMCSRASSIPTIPIYIYIHLCAYKGWCPITIHHLLRRRRSESVGFKRRK